MKESIILLYIIVRSISLISLKHIFLQNNY